MRQQVPESPRELRHRGDRWFPALLLLLALFDLRVELSLLGDHITLTTLGYAIRHHLLAVSVLVAMPSLWRRYGPSHNR